MLDKVQDRPAQALGHAGGPHGGHRLAPFRAYGVELASRLLLGTAQYPSPQVLSDAVKASGAAVVTVSLRREAAACGCGHA